MPQLQEDIVDFIFQQDGAPPHYNFDVRAHLNAILPGRWIGRASHNDSPLLPWPPRSPDLNPCDFFLWGYIKDRVYVPPEEDLFPNQMTVDGTTLCNTVYGLFSWNAEDTNNEGKAKRANNPNEYNSAIAEGKSEHTDANKIRNLEVRNLTLENEGGIGRDGTLQGRSNVRITRSYDVEGLGKGEKDSSLSIERLRIEEKLSCEEKCKLLELGDATCLNIDFKCKANCLNRATVDQYHFRYGVKSGNRSKRWLRMAF